MQFSVVALTLLSAVAVQADAISQIGDGQIQATTATPAPSSSAAPVSTASSNTTAVVPETANGANQVTGGVFVAGLVAAGALLI
ncbi:uncharacterized protein ZBAI_09191 [Zygosaccharomyces bailii ISA1307]|nr:uncharacterized protein ZBAI_09191 [Zygosaccharomyces bailii ISA1307]